MDPGFLEGGLVLPLGRAEEWNTDELLHLRSLVHLLSTQSHRARSDLHLAFTTGDSDSVLLQSGQISFLIICLNENVSPSHSSASPLVEEVCDVLTFAKPCYLRRL